MYLFHHRPRNYTHFKVKQEIVAILKVTNIKSWEFIREMLNKNLHSRRRNYFLRERKHLYCKGIQDWNSWNICYPEDAGINYKEKSNE